MKKNILFISVFVFIFFLLGCNEKTENTNSTITSTSDVIEIEKVNEKQNNKIYKQFEDKFNWYLKNLTESNYLTNNISMTVSMKSNDSYISSTSTINTKVSLSPLYIEVSGNVDGADQEIVLLTEKEGKIYKSNFITSELIDRDYLMDYAEFEKNLLTNYTNEDYLNFTFDVTKGNASKDNNTYTFIQQYKDILTQEETSFLTSIYNELGLEATSFLDLKLKTTFTFVKSDLICNFTLNMPYVIDNKNFDIKVNMEIKFDYSKFKYMNLNGYKYLMPTRAEDVYDFSKVGEAIEFNASESWVKFELEPGLYTFRNDDHVIPNIFDFELFDENLENIEIDYLLGNTDHRNRYELQRYFKINKPGVYYFKINGHSDVYSLEKINYESNFEDINVNVNETIKCTVSDQHSYAVIKFNLDEDCIVSLTSLTEDKVTFFAQINGYYDSLYSYNTLPGVFVGHKGENVIYVSHDLFIFSQVYEYNYKFTLKTYKGSGYEEKYEDLELLTSSPSKNLYVAGYGIEGGKLRLTLDKPQLVIFCEDRIDGTSQFFKYDVQVYDTGNVQYLHGFNTYILEAGNYIVSLSKDTNELTAGYVYAKFENINYNAEFEIDLEKTKLLDRSQQDFPTILIYNKFEEENIKYYFTLEEDACIIGELYALKFYDSNDNEIPNNGNSVFLNKGRYYFKSISIYSMNNYDGLECKIGIPDYKHNDIEIELVTGDSTYYTSSYVININKNEETEFFKYHFELNEDSTLYFYDCYIYDENGKICNLNNFFNTIDLKAGKYYAIPYMEVDKIYLAKLILNE